MLEGKEEFAGVGREGGRKSRRGGWRGAAHTSSVWEACSDASVAPKLEVAEKRSPLVASLSVSTGEGEEETGRN